MVARAVVMATVTARVVAVSMTTAVVRGRGRRVAAVRVTAVVAAAAAALPVSVAGRVVVVVVVVMVSVAVLGRRGRRRHEVVEVGALVDLVESTPRELTANVRRVDLFHVPVVLGPSRKRRSVVWTPVQR